MGWSTPYHPSTEALESCVTCGLCLPVCPTFRITGDESASPRGRLAAMTIVDEGRASVDQRFADVMSLCLQCRACETACPSLVPFGEAMEGARAEVEAQVGEQRSWMRRSALTRLLRSRVLLRLATIAAALLQRVGLLSRIPVLGRQAVGLRRLPLPVASAAGGSWGPSDPARPLAVLLSGCVADVWFSPVHRATIRTLTAAGYRVEAPKTQTCCGALAAHAGYASDAEDMAMRNIDAMGDADVIVADVAGCGAHLRTYQRHGEAGRLVASKVVDVNDLVARAIEDGRLPVFESHGSLVGVQDPCHLEHGLRSHTAVDVVVTAAGFVPVPIDRGGLCCGAAGSYQLEHPEMASELGRRKAAAVSASGVSLVASANAGCEMQLRRFVGGGVGVVHPIELYAEALDRSGRG